MALAGSLSDPVPSAVGLRVVLADGSLLVRDGLARILRERGVDVVGLAATEIEAVATVRSQRPDVVVLDVRMPPSYIDEGILAAEAIRRHVPETGILVLAHDAEREHVLRLISGIRSGIGYLLKDRVTDWHQLADGMIRVAGGGTALDPTVVEMLMRARTQPPKRGLTGLSDREHAVLALIAEGLTNRGIAERMHVSVRTVESHVNALFTKLSLAQHELEHRRVMAVLAYLSVTRS